MLFILRKLRRSFFQPGKVRTYVAYAAGEIALIVIGILIAVEISDWNESIKLREREKILLTELVVNLQTNIVNLENDIDRQVISAGYLQLLLEHLDNQQPYDASLDDKFHEGQVAPDVVLASSAFETLKSNGLGLIRSDSLRREIINLFEVVYPTLMQSTKRIEDQVWPAVVVPLFQKHFRQEIPGKSIPMDYDALLKDKEFTNMLSFRLSMRDRSTVLKREVANKTEEVIALIETEL